MEEKAKANLLRQMADYDFTSPMCVTMIFDDSDDDSDSCKSTTEEISCLITDKNNTNNTQADKKETHSNTTEISNMNENIGSHKISSNLQEYNNYYLSRNIHLGKEPLQTMESNTNREASNYRIQNINNSISTSIKTTEYSTSPTLCQKNYANEKANNHANIYINSKEYRKRKSNEPEKETEKQYNKSKWTHNGHTYENTTTVSKQNRLADFRIKSRVDNLLATLSHNLILIMNSYYQMRTKRESIKDVATKTKIENTFFYVRNYFLHLSYSTLVTFILPEENNTDFMKKFLDNTIKMASDNKGVKYNRQQLEPFFKEMLEWARKRKEGGMDASHRKNPIHENILLRGYLKRPPILPNFSSIRNLGVNQEASTCIFSSGPPGRETSININSDTLAKYTVTNNSFQTSDLRYPKNQQDSNEYSNGNQTIGPNHNILKPTEYQQLQPTVTRHDTVASRQQLSQIINSASQNSILRPTLYLQKTNEYCFNYPTVNPTQATIDNNFKSVGLHESRLVTKKYNNHIPANNLLHNTINSPIMSRQPPPYPVNQSYHNINYYQPIIDQQMQNTQTQFHTNIIRSESTESGYITPSCDNMGTNLNPMNDVPIEDQPMLTPVISNIISLNPGHTCTCKGECPMCGKITRTTLYGCYCSNICQELGSQYYNN